jgi:hypothetical protein
VKPITTNIHTLQIKKTSNWNKASEELSRYQAGLALKNPPKKTHPKKTTQKNPLKMFFFCFFGFFKLLIFL